MKKFLKITGYVFLSLLVCLYLVFLFVLPNKIDLNVYKPEIQKLVKDNTDLTVDFDRVDVITSPFLEAGIKTKNIKVKLPDDSLLFSAESFKGKVFLPSLLWLSVKVSCAEFESPELNVEIINSEKYKVAKVYEDLVNRKRAQRRLNPPQEVIDEANQLPFDPASIKLVIPALKLNNYKAVIDDTKSSHKLTLRGENLKAGYFNGKVATLKTEAEFLSDNDKNITANLDINTFVPAFTPSQEEEDDEAVFALPFVNPVSEYRAYNLKSDINSKLKIRQSKKDNKIWAKGFVNIDKTTITMSGLQLPESYLYLKAKGKSAEVDSNLYITGSEYLKLAGEVDYSEKPYIDLSLKSSKVYFSNLLNIVKAYLDTIHIKNDIASMSASGYLFSNFRIKTNFEDLESDGKFIIRDGNIFNRNMGLLFNDINANLIFDENVFRVRNTHVLINKQPLYVSGKIDANSIANVNIQADRIPLPGLYKAFAPRDIKNAYDLKSGFLTLNTKVVGEIKDIAALCTVELTDFVVVDRGGKFTVSNKLARVGVTNFSGVIRGKMKNQEFKLDLPATKSVIADDLIIANIEDKDIVLKESKLKLNNSSTISFSGKVADYLSNPSVKIIAKGILADSDLKILAGEALAPYLDSKGGIPLKADFESKGDKMKAVVQMQSSANAYITPVKLDEFVGRELLVQLLAEKNKDTVKVYKSGLYVRRPNAVFRDNLALNLLNSVEVIGVRAMVSNLSSKPFVNLFKITIPKDLNGSICVFPKSKFTFGGHLYSFGNFSNMKISGDFNIRNLSIPEVMTNVRNISMNLASRDIKININDVNANGSDFNINMLTNWKLLSQMRLADVRVYSRLVDVDKLLKVSDSLMKSLPKSGNAAVSSAPADIPVEILRGAINLRKITTGDIVVQNTTGNISLFKNVLYLNKLRTIPMGGNVNGDASMNLVSTELNAKLSGKNFNIEKVLLDAMKMKDMLSGNLNFIADISLKGTTVEEQMKTLKGYVDFNVKDGQLGPFGKFENFLMAENLRENAFFSSTIGSVITNIVTIDTSHFNTLYGHLTFNDGFADIAPIKSQGDVMSMYIAGKVGLVDNSADLKLRGKLASTFSDSLGPLANINPVNLIKNTPGLNIVAAKTFAIFCEAVSEEEMQALPSLAEGKSDDYATKFQIVLRGDTRKPLKMIKSFKWLALDSEIESAKNFVDTIPIPEPGEEGLSVDELIKLRAEQAADSGKADSKLEKEESAGSLMDKIKSKFKKDESKI